MCGEDEAEDIGDDTELTVNEDEDVDENVDVVEDGPLDIINEKFSIPALIKIILGDSLT